MLKFTQFCNFQRALEKSLILKIAVQVNEARDFLNIS